MAINRTRTLGALTAALIASGVAIGSGANFSTSTQNPGNSFTAGTLEQTNSKDGLKILPGLGNMKPGDSQTDTVTITNDGSLAGTFTLTQVTPSNGFENLTGGDNVLDLKIEDVTDTAAPATVYDGDFHEAATQALGSFAAAEDRTYKFTVSLASAATNASQGAVAGSTFKWDSVPTAGAAE